jgi:hypothetical protein
MRPTVTSTVFGAVLVLSAAVGGAEDARRIVLDSCRKVPDDDFGLDSFERQRLDAIRALGDSGRRELLRLAKDRTKGERLCAWGFLVSLKDERVVPILRAALTVPSDTKEARRKAATLLAASNDAASLEGIVRLLESDDMDTWIDAVQALGDMKGDRAREVVRDLMRRSLAKGTEELPWKRGALLLAIGKQRDEAMVPLVVDDLKRTKQTDSDRSHTCGTLALIGTRSSIEIMMGIFREARDPHRTDSIASFATRTLMERRAEWKDDDVPFFESVIAELKPFLPRPD